MPGLMLYLRFRRARSLRSDRAERTLWLELWLELGRYVPTERPFLGFSPMSRVSSARVFVRINLFRIFIFRKNVHVDFYGLSDIDSVVTDFDPNS